MHEKPAIDFLSNAHAFWHGCKIVPRNVLCYVVFTTFIGVGALAHDYGFSLAWVMASTLLVWAGPAQVILITTLGTGAGPLQAALAVCLSSIRLFPMVVSLLPMLRTRETRLRDLVWPTHLTAVTFWVVSLREVPSMARERRLAFCNGLGTTLIGICLVATLIGYHMAAQLPPAIAAGVLFLTPISFLLSVASNNRNVADWIALLLGLALTPLVALAHTGVDVLISGTLAGAVAYGVDRWRRRVA